MGFGFGRRWKWNALQFDPLLSHSRLQSPISSLLSCSTKDSVGNPKPFKPPISLFELPSTSFNFNFDFRWTATLQNRPQKKPKPKHQRRFARRLNRRPTCCRHLIPTCCIQNPDARQVPQKNPSNLGFEFLLGSDLENKTV